MDEIWMHMYECDPETKEESKDWRHGIFLVDYIESVATVTSKYCVAKI
jgi:hypothetical protein